MRTFRLPARRRRGHDEAVGNTPTRESCLLGNGVHLTEVASETAALLRRDAETADPEFSSDLTMAYMWARNRVSFNDAEAT